MVQKSADSCGSEMLSARSENPKGLLLFSSPKDVHFWQCIFREETVSIGGLAPKNTTAYSSRRLPDGWPLTVNWLALDLFQRGEAEK